MWRVVLLLLAPLVLLPDLLLLRGSEVVLDVEGLPDLLRRLALDHVGHRLAGDVEEALDVKVVGGEDQLEQGALVNLEEENASFLWSWLLYYNTLRINDRQSKERANAQFHRPKILQTKPPQKAKLSLCR